MGSKQQGMVVMRDLSSDEKEESIQKWRVLVKYIETNKETNKKIKVGRGKYKINVCHF